MCSWSGDHCRTDSGSVARRESLCARDQQGSSRARVARTCEPDGCGDADRGMASSTRTLMTPVAPHTSDRACPVCGAAERTLVHRKRFALPDNHPLSERYDVVQCTTCGFVFAD